MWRLWFTPCVWVLCPMRDVWGDLLDAFADPARNWRQTVYVYRLNGAGSPIRPYLMKAQGGFDDDCELFDRIQHEFGGGDFRVLIRDGSRMVFSGDISIGEPR